jgi:hypothetical protein
MRRAIIEGGVVVNIIETAPEFTMPGKTLVLATNEARIGGSWNGASFGPAPVPPPPSRWRVPLPTILNRLSDAQGEEFATQFNALPGRVRLRILSEGGVWSDNAAVRTAISGLTGAPDPDTILAL